MHNEELINRIAKLESLNDQLLTELQYLDELVKIIGFENGLASLKEAALELIEEENLQDPPEAM